MQTQSFSVLLTGYQCGTGYHIVDIPQFVVLICFYLLCICCRTSLCATNLPTGWLCSWCCHTSPYSPWQSLLAYPSVVYPLSQQLKISSVAKPYKHMLCFCFHKFTMRWWMLCESICRLDYCLLFFIYLYFYCFQYYY